MDQHISCSSSSRQARYDSVGMSTQDTLAFNSSYTHGGLVSAIAFSFGVRRFSTQKTITTMMTMRAMTPMTIPDSAPALKPSPSVIRRKQ